VRHRGGSWRIVRGDEEEKTCKSNGISRIAMLMSRAEKKKEKTECKRGSFPRNEFLSKQDMSPLVNRLQTPLIDTRSRSSGEGGSDENSDTLGSRRARLTGSGVMCNAQLQGGGNKKPRQRKCCLQVRGLPSPSPKTLLAALVNRQTHWLGGSSLPTRGGYTGRRGRKPGHKRRRGPEKVVRTVADNPKQLTKGKGC